LSIRVISPEEIHQQDHFSASVRETMLQKASTTGRAPRYHIMTFGCQQNENDSERMAGLLDQMGYEPATTAKEADLILLNTCSVRENADDRFFGHLGLVKNIRRDKPGLIVGLAGCMMTQEDHVAKIRQSYPFVDLVFGPQDIYRLPELLYHRLTDTRRVYDVGEDDTLSEGQPVHRGRKHRALVSIMFGCNNFCTYCIVPYTRGRERSRSPGDILGEIGQLVQNGYKEIMLLGQNVNSYGLDLRRDDPSLPDFADLVAQIGEIPNLYRIRFMTSHPKDISDKLLETIGRYPNIEPHIHLPLQSGSDRILKAMNRHYTQAEFIEIARKARQLRPGLTLSTDLIVGFPGETEEDFAATLQAMSAIRFDAAFTFQYSRRSGTPAAEYPEQVDDQTVKERFGRLLDLQNAHSLASNQSIEQTLQEILIEGRSENDPQVITGRTAHNRLVNVKIPTDIQFPAEFCAPDGSLNAAKLEGQIAQIFITRAKTFSLEGRWESLLPWA
jgi:tRNA-2-methylthio-N6-dimethylallyladenosine synthase